MSGTIFAKIIAGQIPCTKIYEDEHTFAFLDIGPINKGHVLVVPKHACADIHEAPDEVVAAVAVTVKKVAAAVKAATKAEGVNILSNNGKAAGQETEKYGEGEAAAMGESIRNAL